MSLSQSRRAINERRRRVNQRKKRRRCVFVHDYIRTKYAEIYNETNRFYQNLCDKHPEKADLTRSKEYREWKRKLLDQSESATRETSDLDQSESATRESSDANQSESDRETAEATVPIQNICAESTIATANCQEPSILQIAAEELLPIPISIEEMDEVVEGIIRELEVDEQIRDLVAGLNSDDDEGIEINVDTELESILEPFDYELEVEGADW